MKEINQIKAVLTEHKYCSSSELLAQVLASACCSTYNVNLLKICRTLDSYNKDLVFQLMNVNYHWLPDNKPQIEALEWLKNEKFIK